MAIGKFHDPVTGKSFIETVQSGDYEVMHDGRVLEYTTSPGNAKSQCKCPICGKVFDVDLMQIEDPIPIEEDLTPIEDPIPIENPVRYQSKKRR